jgi:DNA repair exonuclease SbcCD ATPase subunit
MNGPPRLGGLLSLAKGLANYAGLTRGGAIMYRSIYFRQGLCEEANENDAAAGTAGGGNGAAPGASAPAAEAKTQEQQLTAAEAAAKVKDTKISIAERLTIATKALTGGQVSEAGLHAQLTTAQADLKAAQQALQAKEAELGTVQGQLTAANDKIAALEKERGEVEAKVAELEAVEKDLAKRTNAGVKETLAGLGVPDKQLPGVEDKSASNADDLAAAASAERDPVRKGELAKQAWDAMWPKRDSN